MRHVCGWAKREVCVNKVPYNLSFHGIPNLVQYFLCHLAVSAPAWFGVLPVAAVVMVCRGSLLLEEWPAGYVMVKMQRLGSKPKETNIGPSSTAVRVETCRAGRSSEVDTCHAVCGRMSQSRRNDHVGTLNTLGTSLGT